MNWINWDDQGKDWEDWEGREGCKTGDTIRMLPLNLVKGTLTVYKNNCHLGLMKDGLSGPYCWYASVSRGAARVSIHRNSALNGNLFLVDEVVKVIQNCNHESGIYFYDIVNQVSLKGFSNVEIRDAVDNLCDEGLITQQLTIEINFKLKQSSPYILDFDQIDQMDPSVEPPKRQHEDKPAEESFLVEDTETVVKTAINSLTSLSKIQGWRLVRERHLVDAQGAAVAEQIVQVCRDVPPPAEERRGARVGGVDVLGRDQGRFVQVFLGEQHDAGDRYGLRGVSEWEATLCAPSLATHDELPCLEVGVWMVRSASCACCVFSFGRQISQVAISDPPSGLDTAAAVAPTRLSRAVVRESACTGLGPRRRGRRKSLRRQVDDGEWQLSSNPPPVARPFRCCQGRSWWPRARLLGQNEAGQRLQLMDGEVVRSSSSQLPLPQIQDPQIGTPLI
ncbi:hypothetical protein THAOC_22988 [Thalassiosira oceanica]|uniref:Replication protein A C-terminal domain-containing protein n=1 Tax=Thalassiosira oceanica TaxID=159749 RepID=K0S7Y6_THAOC|nr:hypothetical protein THAOC_22988 [Thalassiosira oceanica]|eukprot:EJK57016.1 hypothetical protein THAOC_22988 [Thalassiosira oceanica]